MQFRCVKTQDTQHWIHLVTIGPLVYLCQVMRKRVLCHMWTTKVQITLRIRAVWSAPLLFAAWIVWYVYLLYPKFQDSTPQPLYNTIAGVQAHFRVSYPNRVITRVKFIGYIGKWVLNSHLGSNSDPCYIQNRVITNRVIKRFRCS